MGACCGCESKENKDGRERDQVRDRHHERSGGDRENHRVSHRSEKGSPSSNREAAEKEQKMIMYVAQFDYEPSSPAELALKKGDRVQFLSNEPANFMFVRAAKQHGTRGYVAAEYLARQGSGTDEDYYYGEIRRRDVTKVLMEPNLPAGTFLVRGSGGQQGSSGSVCDTDGEQQEEDAAAAPLVISVKDGATPPRIHHYRVHTTLAGQFYLKPHVTFPTVRELIKYYQGDQGSGDIACKLAEYLPKPVPVKRPLPEDMRDRWREIPREQLQLTAMLGAGRFGEVRKAIWKQPNGQTLTVVAKQLKDLKVEDKKLLLDEAGTMKDLRHENVVRLYGVVSVSEPYFLVTEFVKDGSLQEYLRKRRKYLKPPLEASALISISVQIARGMAYFASKRLVHRDLASRNILIDVKTESPFSCVAKVADFGLARMLNKDYIYRMKHETYIATRWLAPEGFDTLFSTETDVWAFGVTVDEMFCGGEDPWGDLAEREVIKRIISGRGPDKPPSMPASVYEIVKRCCQKDPSRRPKFAQLASDLEALLKA